MSSTTSGSAELARLGVDVLPRLMRTLHVLSAHPAELNVTSITQFRVLKRLVQHPWLVSELAHSLQLSVPTVSVAVDSLVRRGLVERNEAVGDRRAVLLSLTAEGVRSFEAASERFLDALLQIIERLPEEDQQALRQGLAAVAQALDEIVPARGNGSIAELC